MRYCGWIFLLSLYALPPVSAANEANPRAASQEAARQGHADQAFEILYEASLRPNAKLSGQDATELFDAYLRFQKQVLIKSEARDATSLRSFDERSRAFLKRIEQRRDLPATAKADAWVARADINEQMLGRVVQAEGDLVQATRIDPKRAAVWRRLLAFAVKRDEAPLVALRGAALLALEPKDEALRKQVVRALLTLRDTAKAARLSANQAPDAIYLWARAEDSAVRGDWARAETLAAQASALPSDASAQVSLRSLQSRAAAHAAQTLLRQNREAQALAKFDEAYRLNPQDVGLRKSIAQRIFAHWQKQGLPRSKVATQDYAALVAMLEKLPGTLDSDRESLTVLWRAAQLANRSDVAARACASLRKDFAESLSAAEKRECGTR